ncbi:MAG TPA: M15 family metallopeptidase [Chitinophagaceae bacterium]|nr:M15 family metallopeptidase [Chitinophagaceae bacterium]
MNKLIKGFHFRAGRQAIFSALLPLAIQAQSTGSVPAAPGLPVIRSLAAYRALVARDSAWRLVELRTLIPDLVYDLRYAGHNNFTGRILYGQGTRTFLQAGAARALARVASDLRARGLGLKIFDAYRPYSVTVRMWRLIHDARYVADPAQGSGHNRGLAVDLTLIRLDTGRELDMGTGFDNFTDSAHTDFRQLPEPVLENRRLLRSILEKYGFRSLETEWWHFSYPHGGDPDSSVLDIDFRRLP